VLAMGAAENVRCAGAAERNASADLQTNPMRRCWRHIEALSVARQADT